MNGMKGSLNSRLDRRYTTSIMVFCFVVGTEIESVFEVEGQAGMSISKLKDMIYDKKKNNFEGKGFDPSDLHLWKVDIPGDTKNVKLETLESRSHDINNENTTIQELGGRRLTPFESLGDIFDNDSKNIRIIAQPPTTESPMKKRRLWYRDPKEANVIQDSSNKDQKVPVSESEFKRVREYRKLYVDKTEWLTRLELNSGQYFVSRPRKFGKSMFLSMVESFFLVQYNLFENLYIRDHPPNIFINNKAEKWSENLPSIPVIRLDFSLLTSDEGPEKLKKSLIRVLQLAGEEYDIDIDTDTANYDVKGATLELITSLAGDDKNEYRQVVILIDEYDSPLLNVIGITKENTQIANDSHGVLKSFFEVIKALQSKVKFLLVTGVTMFAHLGLFSGLNNLKDITLSDELSGAYGFTGDEITKAFGDKLSNLCKSDDHYRDVQDAMNRLQKKYNGYSWNGKIKVYNPYSICSFFESSEYENFWIQKGKTKFLARLINMEHVKNIVDEITIKKRLVVPVDVDDIQKSSDLPVSLLFQTGYLTIKQQKTDDDGEQCLVLEIPNAEVKESLMSELWASLNETSIEIACKRIGLLAKLLKDDNIIAFLKEFNNDLASIPYFESQHAGKYEGYYHSHIHMLVRYIGLPFRSEDATSEGRTDMWIETRNIIYYFEFKRYDPDKKNVIMSLVEEAINQIFETKYYIGHTDPESYNKTRYAIGCVCSTGTRKICGVGIQEFTYRSNRLEKKELQNFLDGFQ